MTIECNHSPHWNDESSIDDSEDPRQLFVARVTVCQGWAIHGVIFEFLDGHRAGVLLTNSGWRMSLTDNDIQERGGANRWVNVAPGDYITKVSGRQLRAASIYLCHTLILEFASGQAIYFEGGQQDWRGEPFSYEVTQPLLVTGLEFGRGLSEEFPNRGYCKGVIGNRTSIHLPFSKPMVVYLPDSFKMQIFRVTGIAREMDAERKRQGRASVGTDAWWKVLGYLVACLVTDMLEEKQQDASSDTKGSPLS